MYFYFYFINLSCQLFSEYICITIIMISRVEMAVKKDNSKFITGKRVLRVELDAEGLPSNVRKAVADVILELVDRLLTQVPDDTKSLSRAINVGSTDLLSVWVVFLGSCTWF